MLRTIKRWDPFFSLDSGRLPAKLCRQFATIRRPVQDPDEGFPLIYIPFFFKYEENPFWYFVRAHTTPSKYITQT